MTRKDGEICTLGEIYPAAGATTVAEQAAEISQQKNNRISKIALATADLMDMTTASPEG